MGRGHRGRQQPAFRRAVRLRRPACRVHGLPRRLQALDAGPPDRRVGRCRRQAGLPPDPADPRAAHPPREGHLQHLHRAGAAGGDGLDVRRVPRPGRPDPHRPPHPPPGRPPGRRAAQERRGRGRALLRHPARAQRRRRRAAGQGRGRWLQPARDRQRGGGHQPGRNRYPRRRRRAGRAVRRHGRRGRAGRGHRRRAAGRPGAPVRVPDPPGVQHPPQRARTAALPAFAGRQGPGDGPHDDPAGLVHHEAQRHRRDDPGDLAGVPLPTRRRATRN